MYTYIWYFLRDETKFRSVHKLYDFQNINENIGTKSLDKPYLPIRQ